ncbi:hypothetical protein K458DRAFT_441826 [Lentithecium fluviatile CBS 122367]|uniref:Carrier domain-containing protein n=1 Tax=Lentithecium fluviatile CBS 122367 TaxID=1168545 RepID=A0A6G1J6R9_9PLEO|nr:hypothetical protein K458DRAFT_441826 [Lentithecium fluviatile CBS 122367]
MCENLSLLEPKHKLAKEIFSKSAADGVRAVDVSMGYPARRRPQLQARVLGVLCPKTAQHRPVSAYRAYITYLAYSWADNSVDSDVRSAVFCLGCRWPGGVRDAPGLWELLKEKRSGYKEFGEPRFSSKGFYHPNHDRPGSMATRGGFLLDEDPRLFDPSFFGITGLELETMDASQRKLLEDSISGSSTGVFIGNFSLDHWVTQARDWDYPRSYATTGASTSISSAIYLLGNRISYIFNLNGPSLAIDTACSSSILQIALDKLGALSPTSTCHTFDASADGYARGKGFAAIYLKRLSKAVTDESPIRSVIRGTAVNSNGRTGGITRPSAAGQEAVIRKAYENAGGLALSDTTYFEIHGTGTPVGDPIEVSAVANAFSSTVSLNADRKLLVGSVKTNLGHTEGASALAAIMKVILSLEAGLIPPSIGIKTLNPAIDFEKTNVEVVRDLIPWPKNRLRRASINSFGFGGANGHCIVDHISNVLPGYVKPGVAHLPKGQNHGSNGLSPQSNGHSNGVSSQPNGYSNGVGLQGPQGRELAHQYHPIEHGAQTMVRRTDVNTRHLVLLPFSAHDEQSLRMNIVAISQAMDRHSLADVAYTLSTGRSKLMYRSFRIIDTQSLTGGLGIEQKISQASSTLTKIAFVFTGQGAQWYAMGSQLIESRVFRTAMEYLDYVLSTLPNGPAWRVTDIVTGHCAEEVVQFPEVSQTVCTAVQIGLVDLLASWAIESIAAAWFRGSTVASNTKVGAMLAVDMGPEKAADYLVEFDGQIQIAAINSPNSTTLSGDAPAVQRLSVVLDANGEFNRLLRTGGNAYHSHHMLPIGRDYYARLSEGLAHIQGLGLCDKLQRYTRVPWISSVRPHKTSSAERVDALYWQSNLESPVRFSEAVTNLIDSVDVDVILEVGPHPALKGPIDQTVRSLGRNIPYVSSLNRKEDAKTSMLSLVGTLLLWWVAVHGCTAVDLPPYRYKYGPVIYNESRVSLEYRLRSTLRHDLLGSKVAGNAKLRPQWCNILRLKDLPWLGDHRLLPHPVFPAAGFFAMALVATSQVYEETQEPLQISGYSLRNVNIKTALSIPEDDFGVEVLSMELSDDATARSPQWAYFSHCTGLVKVELAQPMDVSKIGPTVDSRVANARAWYKTFAAIGLGYGPTFQGLSDIRVDCGMKRAVARVDLKTTAGTIFASLDSIFQLGLIACYGGQIENARSAFVPIHLSQLYLKHGNIESEYGTATAHGELRGLRGAYAKLQLSNQAGDVVLDIESLRCISYLNDKSPAGLQTNQFRSPFTRLVWRPDIRMMNNAQCREMFPPPQEYVDRVHLFPTMNRLALVVLVDIYENLINREGGPEPTGNLAHFAAWVRRQVESSDMPEIANARKLSSHDRLRLLEELYSQKDEIVEVKIAKRLHENMDAILREQKTAVEILVQGGLLTALYETRLFMTSAYPQLFNIFESLGHANPNQRILELGAGTGGATRVAMRALVGANGIKRFKDYTFTGISAGFLAPARESLAEHLDVHFSVLDIELDPLSQGYDASYDIVIGSQTLHATTSIANTLENCRRLLKPGGKLVLVENTQNNDLVGIILGTLTGYWHGIPDGRTDSPFLRREAWDVALRSSGFSGAELVLSDYPEPHATTTVLVSTFVPSKGPTIREPGLYSAASTLQLFYGSSQVPVVLSQIFGELQRRKARVQMASLGDAASSIFPNARVVAYLDESNLLLDSDEGQLERFKRLVSNSQSLLLLTSGGIAKGRNPDTSFVPGLLRTLNTENTGSRFISVDLDADAGDFKSVNEHLVRRFVPDDGLEAHTEMPEAKVSRHSQLVPLDSQGPVRAAFEVPGILSSLYFRPYTELQEPLPYDWIVVKVAAVGLNWKDLGLSSGRFDANNLSSEYAGTITELGPNVVGLAVGDRVYGMGKGHFSNYTRVPAVFARKLRPQDDLTEVATMPLVYMTVVYAFERITRLRKGQKVLIQSATGGLGLAAIQLAQTKGAEVYATVGTPDKARFLAKTMKVPAPRIFLSRSINDLSAAAAATIGGGFDTIGLELFQKSANFSSFDLSLVLDRDPQLGSELMKTVDEHYRAGRIAPIRPCRTLHYFGGFGGSGSINRFVGIATDEAQMLVDSLTARGVTIQAVVCDVSKLDDVLRVVRGASSSDRPIKGVIHAAVSYQDISFDKISIERWRASLAAKVLGTRNLHEATLGLSLDFFVMNTSLESVFALATQSAYTAANVFQEAFARYRRQLGLVASTASFGFVSDVGSLATDATTVDMFARNQDPLSAANLFTCLDPAALAKMKHEETVEGGVPSSAPLPHWYSDARVGLIMRAPEDAGRYLNS